MGVLSQEPNEIICWENPFKDTGKGVCLSNWALGHTMGHQWSKGRTRGLTETQDIQ